MDQANYYYFIIFIFTFHFMDVHFLVFKLTLIIEYVQRLGMHSQLLELFFSITNLPH